MSDSNETPQIQDFAAQELAAKHNISIEEAKKLIDTVGTDRGSVDAAAHDMKFGEGTPSESSEI